jgi:ABC-type Mn2+/Zn2+ transport system permease subunit
VGAGVVGIYASYYLDLAAGASIALAAICAFAITVPFRSRS